MLISGNTGIFFSLPKGMLMSQEDFPEHFGDSTQCESWQDLCVYP